MAAHRQTGVLRILTSGSQGEITMREGRILAASYGRLRGREAIFELISQEEGRFRFDAMQVYTQDEVAMDVQAIILESIRWWDESGRGS